MASINEPVTNWGLRIVLLSFVVLALLASIPISFQLWENLDAHQLMIIQSPVDGELNCFTDSGVKWQGFGKVTKYPRRATYEFGKDGKEDNSKKLRFNDGGHGSLYGSSQWSMPLSCPEIIAIHKEFGSAEGVQASAVAKMIDNAVYLSGPLMSSTESSGERRSELVQYINDQAENGVYVTRVIQKEITDPLTNTKKEVAATEIVRDAQGNPRRQQGSILGQFHITLLPLSVADLVYDSVVEDQIKQRQVATTQVQIAQANSLKAEQDAKTAEAQGKALATKAQWEQESIRAKVVTEAKQQLDVATLNAQEAEQYKRQQILIGEGDAARKQLVMTADGALDQKLVAYKEVNAAYAQAIAAAQPGAWTSAVVMGGAGTTGAANASALIDLLTAKTARDLGVDMSVGGRAATVKK